MVHANCMHYVSSFVSILTISTEMFYFMMRCKIETNTCTATLCD